MINLCSVCGGWHHVPSKGFEFFEVEDIHPAYDASGFIVTNEQPELFTELLGDMTFNKVVSICSGGEIPLFVLLPRVTGELIAVDHSYKALAVTIVKTQMLMSLGVRTFQEMILATRKENQWSEYEGRDLKEAAKPFIEALPTLLKTAIQKTDSWGHKLFCSMNCRTLLSHWEKANLEDVERSLWNIRQGKLKLVHGDLTDLVPRGPFDLFYFSNAHEHLSRTKAKPAFENINRLIKSGGHILVTNIIRTVPFDWAQRLSKNGNRSNVSIGPHRLYQKA